jgi:hypothetical protein
MAKILFEDDFEGDAIGQEPSRWKYDPDAEVTDVGMVDNDPLDPNNQVFTGFGGYWADNGAVYTDFVAEWDWMFYQENDRNNSMGFHVQNRDAHYQLSRRSGGADWKIYMYNGSWNEIATAAFPTEIDKWYRVQLSAMGEQITVKVKEKEDPTPFKELTPVLEAADSTFLEGGLSTSYYGPIDNVIIAESEADLLAVTAVEPTGKLPITWGYLKASR